MGQNHNAKYSIGLNVAEILLHADMNCFIVEGHGKHSHFGCHIMEQFTDGTIEDGQVLDTDLQNLYHEVIDLQNSQPSSFVEEMKDLLLDAGGSHFYQGSSMLH